MNKINKTLLLPAILFACLAAFTGCEILPTANEAKPVAKDIKSNDGFVSIFNGKDLTGWTPKIRYEALGEDKDNAFHVKDGMIQVRYDNYSHFAKEGAGPRFGHLFYKTEYSHYILRLEYRIVGKQLAGGPGWAFMNSGVMVHGQKPEDMKKDQDFPHSIEVQLLGLPEESKRKRTTANLCTPGTRFVKDDKLIRAHCINSSSETYRGDEWVKLEIEVHGSEKIIHRVNGEMVLEYQKPQLDDGTLLESGTISLQSESHPFDFRNIEIKVLEK